MNILLICSSDQLALPATRQFISSGHSLSIVVPETHGQHLTAFFGMAGIDSSRIHIVRKAQLENELSFIIAEKDAEIVFVLSFPWKIPAAVLTKPRHGFINLHGGILPKYGGADPVFWQMKNMEANGGVTAHVMTEEMDAGPIISIHTLPIIPGETYGIHYERMSVLAATSAIQCIQKISSGNIAPIQNDHDKSLLMSRPRDADTVIHWQNQSAKEIEALVNACNPKYKGALTTIKQMRLALLEVAPAEISNVPDNIIPGTIVYADHIYGLIVACKDNQFLKINVTQSSAGFLSGAKLFQLGITVEDRFE